MGVVYLDLGVKQAAGSFHLNGSHTSTKSVSPGVPESTGQFSLLLVYRLKRTEKKYSSMTD